MRASSMPAAFASRRASGEANTRVPSALWGGGALGSCAKLGAVPSTRGGEGCGEGDGALAGFACDSAGLPAAGGGPFPAVAAAALGSSPSSASTPMSALTDTSCVPSGTTILASTPSSIDSYSIVALSVSISAITSPALIWSPSRFSHLARVPFSMVGDSAGMRMLTGMVHSSSAVADGLGSLDHLGDRRQGELLEIGRIGHRHVL